MRLRRRGLQQPRVIDAGGARAHWQERSDEWAAQETARERDHERVVKAAGKIPLLKTVEQVKEYATEVQDFFSYRDRSLSFPALQVHKKLSVHDIFMALPQMYGEAPNAVATRTEQTSAGAHFDDYASVARPWTLHENISGSGAITSTFLPVKLYNGYKAFAESLPNVEGRDSLLAVNRAALGAMALEGASESKIYTAELAPGTRTLLWHGGGHHNTPPAVHDFQRDEPGSYKIYAALKSGVEAEGFEPI